jgi:hypothetical protein
VACKKIKTDDVRQIGCLSGQLFTPVFRPTATQTPVTARKGILAHDRNGQAPPPFLIRE